MIDSLLEYDQEYGYCYTKNVQTRNFYYFLLTCGTVKHKDADSIQKVFALLFSVLVEVH